MFSFLYASLHGLAGRRNSALAVAGLSALTLAGCGGSSSGGGGLVSNSGSGGGGSLNAQFSAVAASNAVTSDFSTSNVGGVLTPPAPIVGSTLLVTGATVPSNNTSRQFILTVSDTTLTVGKAYSLTDTNSLSYVDTFDINGKMQRAWISAGGTATIDSISGKTYKFHLTKVTLVPVYDTTTTPIGTVTPGTGTFTVDGTGTATLP